MAYFELKRSTIWLPLYPLPLPYGGTLYSTMPAGCDRLPSTRHVSFVLFLSKRVDRFWTTAEAEVFYTAVPGLSSVFPT